MRHSILVGTHGRPGAAGALRAAAVPVLAVSGKTVGLPGRALITTDFSTSSLNAARVAMQFLAEGAQVTLAHVMPEIDLLDAGRTEWERVYRTGVEASAARMIEEIDPLGVHQFNVVVLHGDPAELLVALAHRTPVDLIVAGSHGRTGLERLMLGSVATKLLPRRTAPRAGNSRPQRSPCRSSMHSPRAWRMPARCCTS